jgi:hypothetical protein
LPAKPGGEKMQWKKIKETKEKPTNLTRQAEEGMAI